MGTALQEVALKAVETGFQWAVQGAEERRNQFCVLFGKASRLMSQYGFTFPQGEPPRAFDTLEISSPIGLLRLDFMKVLDDDGALTCAAVFTDVPMWSRSQDRRLLFVATLKSNGEWLGDDGRGLYAFHDQFVPATALDAVRRALARKLAFDTGRLRVTPGNE